MAFAEVLESIYASGPDRQRWGASLKLISRHCGARSGLLLIREKDSGRLDFWAEHGLGSGYQRPFIQHYRHGDLRLDDLIRHPVGVVRTDSMLPDYAAYVRSPAYRNLYRELGTEHALGGFVHEEGSRSFAIRVFRSCADGHFAAGDVSRFRQLAPHMGRAVALTRRLLRAEANERLLARLFELGELPLCLLSADGGVVMAGLPGRRLLDADGGRIEAAIRQAETRRQTASSIRRPDGRLVRLDRIRADAVDGLGATDLPLWLVFGPIPPASNPVGSAAIRFSLTPAETRLVAALCNGETLASAAARFGVRRETVKSQLRDVFQKTHVRRQADLVRRILLAAPANDGATVPLNRPGSSGPRPPPGTAR